MTTMSEIRTRIERREYVVDPDKVAVAILGRLILVEDQTPERD